MLQKESFIVIKEFIEFASKFISIEELQATIVLVFISISILILAFLTDKYDKNISKGSD